MLGYWIETQFFAAFAGSFTQEQYGMFYKLCQGKVKGLNQKCSEITLCDYTQKWTEHTENDFWKNVDDIDDSHSFVKLFPEGAINISLEGFPPDFIKKRNLFNRVQNRRSPVLPNDPEEKDRNLINEFLELADAIRGIYYGDRGTLMNADELRIAVYEGILMANNATGIDRWHILSKVKYRGKGWSDIARAELERKYKNSLATPTQDAVNKLSREIQRKVEVHRQNILGMGTNESQGN